MTKGIVLNRGPLFKGWTLLILPPTGKTKRTYIRFLSVSPWHPLFGVEPTPAGLEPAVLTVILRGMAPSLRADRRPSGSEPDVQTATLRGYVRRRSGIRATAFIYIQSYHALEQNFLLAYELKRPEVFHDRQLL